MKKAVIIGAGPAGLTCAYELLKRTDIQPIIFEQSGCIGGIARTVNYKGNRIDIGGHRFFSKSERITKWWQNIFPLQDSHNADKEDKLMLLRKRKSSIYFSGRFYDYPLRLSLNTILSLGIFRTAKIGLGYLQALLFPRKEYSLEDFLINKFGEKLYNMFFRDYTQKVWGVACRNISVEWGRQRVKGLSIAKALTHTLKKTIKQENAFEQKQTETSLIERFVYPKYGAGQFWEEVARLIREQGGQIHLHKRCTGIEPKETNISSLTITDTLSGRQEGVSADYFFSSMPIKELIAAFKNEVTPEVKRVAAGLPYRDFVMVGLLLNKVKIKKSTDNWIYIQEKKVKLARIQIFNNWSPHMVRDSSKVWLGLEYPCSEKDPIWNWDDKTIVKFVTEELVSLSLINKDDILEATVIKMPKVYPAYFGTYNRLEEIKRFTDRYENLFLIGRNGQHRYNNTDHSMLTAIIAVENIIHGIKTKDNIWSVNTEEKYHEAE